MKLLKYIQHLLDNAFEKDRQCRVFSWNTIKTDISEFDTMPKKDHCTILKLLVEYI